MSSTSFERGAPVRSVSHRRTGGLEVIVFMRLAVVNFMSDRRFFVENRTHPLAVEPQTESVFLREVRKLWRSIFA